MQNIQLCLRCSHSNLLHLGTEDNSYPCISGGCSCSNYRITSIKPPKSTEKINKINARNKVKE